MFGEGAKDLDINVQFPAESPVASCVPSGKLSSHSLCLSSHSAKWCTLLPLRGFIRKNIPSVVSCTASMAMQSAAQVLGS